MADVFGFGPITARRLLTLSELVDPLERIHDYDPNVMSFNRFIKAPEGGIPARNGTTLGKAECEVLNVDRENDSYYSNTNKIMVYNWTLSVVLDNGSRLGIADRDAYGNWFITAADCSDDE